MGMLTWYPIPSVMRERSCNNSSGYGDCFRLAPERESRLQPVCGWNRLKPGLLGRCPVYQGNQHDV
jgi:hypothetical protein